METLPPASHSHLTVLPSQELETVLSGCPETHTRQKRHAPRLSRALTVCGKAGLVLSPAKMRTTQAFLKKTKHLSEVTHLLGDLSI